MSDILKMDESTEDLCSSHILSEIPEKILDPIEPIPFIPVSKLSKKVKISFWPSFERPVFGIPTFWGYF